MVTQTDLSVVEEAENEHDKSGYKRLTFLRPVPDPHPKMAKTRSSNEAVDRVCSRLRSCMQVKSRNNRVGQ